jgi:hypothetical protein
MATYNLPDLRHSQQSGAGTVTVPAGETWIIKNASARYRHTLGATSEGVTITATINSNAAIVYDSFTQKSGAAGLGEYYVGKPIFCSTMIFKAGDSIQLTVLGSPSVAILDIYYYILESDF